MATKENRVKYETLKKNWKEEMDMKTWSMGMECDVTVLWKWEGQGCVNVALFHRLVVFTVLDHKVVGLIVIILCA